MELNPSLLEELAQLALHSTDHQTKQQAEAQLEKYIFSLPLPSAEFENLFENHSDTVLLAASAKLAQNVSKIPNLGLYLERVNQIFRGWFNPSDGKFIRRNGEPLKRYCVNTIGLFLGRSLKQLFQEKGNQQMVLNWLKMPEQGDKYRLYLFLTFIENVSLIDGSLNFITYKVLLQSFQTEVIPSMFPYLYPYFINFSEDIEVAGLSAMQGRLNIRDQGLRQNEGFTQHKTFSQFSFSIFQLLSEIISFKYNINYKQFDQSEDSKGTISFPESIIKEIVKKDFLQGLYTIINRLIQIPSAESYLQICLQCLEKILSAKSSHIPEEVATKFNDINIKGIVELLDNIIDKNKGSTKILAKIVDCSNMFLDIFGLYKISDLEQLELKCLNYFERWVTRIYSLPILIMSSRQAINAENYLFLTATKAMERIGADLSGLNPQNNFPVVKTLYFQFVEQFFSIFFVSSTNILGDVAFSSLQDLKRTSLSFYEDVIKISSANYLAVFKGIQQLLSSFYNEIQQNSINIANLLLFMAAILQSESFFESNINRESLFEEAKGKYMFPEEIKALAELLYTVLQFIASYGNNKDYFSTHINNALILFYEAMLSRFVKETQAKGAQDEQELGNEIQIKDKVYLVIREYLGVSDDKFLLQGLLGLSRLIEKSEATSIQFLFSCLNALISKIKRKFVRESFKSTDIYRQMLALFNSLVGSSFNHAFIKWRVLLFKTVSLLCFDDALDDYRSNIRNAIALIKNSPEEQLDRVLYDLTGICQGIESSIIFQYFLYKLLSQIDYSALLTKLYEKLGRKEPLLKDILHLTYLFIERKDCETSSAQTYKIIEQTLPFWNHLLERIANDEERIQLFEEIYLIQKCLVDGGHINLGVVDEKVPAQLRKFLYLSMNHFKFFIDHIENYPSYIKSFYELIELFLMRLKNLLYNHQQRQLAHRLTDLMYTLMQKLVLQFQKIICECYNTAIFHHTLQILEKFFQYLQDSKDYIHRRMYREHLSEILQTNEEKVRFIMHIFMLGLHFGNRKEMDTLGSLGNMAINLCLNYNFDATEMAQRIGVQDAQDREQFIRIVSNIKEGKQSDWIFFQLRDWFKKNDRFNSSVINGY